MLPINELKFVKVTNKDLINFIETAKQRIIIAKPAFSNDEVDSIVTTVKKNKLKCKLFIESGDKAIRYGFGQAEALETIKKNFNYLNVQTVERIRMCFLIVDNSTLVFMPDIKLIDEKIDNISFPNGFIVNEILTTKIINELFNDKKQLSLENIKDNIIPIPGCDIPVGKADLTTKEIEKTINDLKLNPAIESSKLRRINFYRNNYKIFKMQVYGVKIENKKISLKSFNILLTDVNERLISSWNIFTTNDINDLQDTRIFEKELNKIIQKDFKNYIYDVGRFGYIIDITKKDEFDKKIKEIVESFKKFLKHESDEEINKRFSTNLDDDKGKKKDLKIILGESKKELSNYLYKMCSNDKNMIEEIFKFYRHLKYKYEDGENEEKVKKEFITMFIMDKLKFTDEDEIINKIDIKIDYYDVSDELIFSNEDFEKYILKYDLELRQNSIGYEENKK